MIFDHFIFTLFFVGIDMHVGTAAIIAEWIHPHITTTVCPYLIEIIISCAVNTTVLAPMSTHIILMLQPTVVKYTSLL